MAYYNAPLPHSRSSRDHFIEAPSILRILVSLPTELVAAVMQRYWDRNANAYTSVSTNSYEVSKSWMGIRERNWNPRRLLCLPHFFVGLWLVLLLWGERWVFQDSVKACRWQNWERWPKGSTPHHLIFLADPQLIDPHSYPGRPWPLDKFTFLHTDNYLKRSYINLQKMLHPDTIFFLGDLMDGGREWKPAHGNLIDSKMANGQRPSGEQDLLEYWGKRYGQDFWLHEYDRFGRIFYNFWNLGGSTPGPYQRGRRIISSLPGNHDLGFGAHIQIPVRDRFETYFGEGNRVDVIGNHTFVSVDAVSLSAGGADDKEIVRPVDEFLGKVQKLKRIAVARELSYLAGKEPALQYPHHVENLKDTNWKDLPTLDPGKDSADLPTILLTHVPLYRDPGTPCGPKREHWPPQTPPKGQTSPVIPDHRNALSISGGYQYQNVLSEEDSVKLVSAVGNVMSVFSGDDHDYCEIVHPENKNRAREITVKAMSWAMGVRKPGFLMLSMWNPINVVGEPLHSGHSGHGSTEQTTSTTESHLCLLPDQLSIFIRYLILILITLSALIIRAVLTPYLNLSRSSSPPPGSELDSSLLPITNKPQEQRDQNGDHSSNSSTSSTSSNNSSNLAARSSAARTRSISPSKGYGLPASQIRFTTPPLINQSSKGNGYSGDGFTESHVDGYGFADRWSAGEVEKRRASTYAKPKKETKRGIMWKEARTSIWRTAWLVLGIYFYLCWYG